MCHPARSLSGFLILVLAWIPGRTFAQATLGDPVAATSFGLGAGTSAQIAAQLSPEAKDLAEQIYRALGPSPSPAATGNAAVGLWMVGRLQVALQLMGKAIAADPTNIDNQCNYAAMLTMSGGASLAIPTLEKLARQFPDNSTVLNNLGQACYLAGKETDAEKHLTRALAVAPQHPRAADTLSRIAEDKGDDARAVALAKQAIQRSLSLDKLNRLRKLGYKLTLEDLSSYRPPNPDPLGLENIVAPEFPRNAFEEYRARREWKDFYQQLNHRLQSLQQQLNAVQAPARAAAIAQAQAAYAKLTGQAAKPAGGPVVVTETPAGNPAASTVQPRARRANLMLDLLDRDTAARLRLQKARDAWKARIEQGITLVRTEYRAEHDKLSRQESTQVGEGLANRSFCAEFVTLADKYLGKWNDGREALYRAYLRELRLKLAEEVYWKQFSEPKPEFQATVLKAEIEWLAAVGQTGIGSDGVIGIQVDDSCLASKLAPRNAKLSNFNDVHCQYHSELNLGIGSIVTDCDKTLSTLGVGPVKLGLNQDMAQGTDFLDSFVSCNVEVSAGKSVGAHVGPLSVEVGAEAGMGIEIGRDGVQDVYVTGKVGASAMDVVTTGAEGRMSLMSGSSSVDILK